MRLIHVLCLVSFLSHWNNSDAAPDYTYPYKLGRQRCSYACTPVCTYTCQTTAIYKEPPSEDEVTADYTKKLLDLLALAGTTMVAIEEVAMDDNAKVGGKMVATLQKEIAAAAQILLDFIKTPPSAPTGYGYRAKRQAKKGGEAAVNGLADVMAKSGDKIAGDMKDLGDKAQKRIGKKQKAALENCSADSCKAAAKLLAEEDGERQ